MREHVLDLAALKVADEVPARAGRRAARPWRTSSCARFSPAQRDAGVGERADLLDRHVLDGGESSTSAGRARAPPPPRSPRARAARLRAHPLGVEAVDQLRHATPAWRPVTPPSRRWEKNSAGSRRSCTAPASWTSVHPGRPQPRARDRLEVDVAPVAVAGPRSANARADLLAGLVAAAAGARADRRGERASPSSPNAATPSATTPAASPRQPACSIADRAAAGQRDRQAVGREDDRRHARGSSPDRRTRHGLAGRAARPARARWPRGPGDPAGSARGARRRGRRPARGSRETRPGRRP